MKIQTVENLAKQFRSFLISTNSEIFEMKLSDKFYVKDQWFAKKPLNFVPNSDKPGLYFFTSLSGEVWYIGKGNQKTDGGIGRRIWEHLNKPSKSQDGYPTFPYHQWKENYEKTTINPETKSLIEIGDFLVYTIEINPPDYVELFEIYLLTMALVTDRRADGRPAELNFKKG
jgi:hypothetical protein